MDTRTKRIKDLEAENAKLRILLSKSSDAFDALLKVNKALQAVVEGE
jgi:hypothetical protein